MGRLWKIVDGEPYMINDPRLGILALNPKQKGKSMARHHGKRYMAWVRSHRRKRNAYPLAGPALAANPRRRRHHRRKRNPSRIRHYATRARGFLGLPPMMPIVYGSVGFVATAAVDGFIWGDPATPTSGFIPTSWKTNADGTPNLLTKYAVLAGSLIATTWIAKSVLGPGPAALAGIGGGVYVVSNVVKDFLPNTIPGMKGPINLAAYQQTYRRSQLSSGGVKAYQSTLRAPDFGAQQTVNSAQGGGGSIVAARFRRFQ